MNPLWGRNEFEEAEKQGWNVFQIFEHGKKVELGIFAEEGGVFRTDEEAREFVAMAAKAGKELAIKAVKAVFLSRCGIKEKT